LLSDMQPVEPPEGPDRCLDGKGIGVSRESAKSSSVPTTVVDFLANRDPAGYSNEAKPTGRPCPGTREMPADKESNYEADHPACPYPGTSATGGLGPGTPRASCRSRV